jgi:hypothetical protein
VWMCPIFQRYSLGLVLPRGCQIGSVPRSLGPRLGPERRPLEGHHHAQSRGEYLGSVEAPDREKAEAVAIKQFDLNQDQRSRLLIRERL